MLKASVSQANRASGRVDVSGLATACSDTFIRIQASRRQLRTAELHCYYQDSSFQRLLISAEMRESEQAERQWVSNLKEARTRDRNNVPVRTLQTQSDRTAAVPARI